MDAAVTNIKSRVEAGAKSEDELRRLRSDVAMLLAVIDNRLVHAHDAQVPKRERKIGRT